ncbi:UDP-N-acetylglucosamine 1-carboxyvinyltransferase [Dongia mobilis]|uniref:UDP-N-acetylglucosamine 1-carboxyvinyltransferase n=1 Tax=Dongia mobilis TaxID=578943 RepID=A0A4R6WI67_9PROT|nr:UDP-N-acetylglucosamine 1-carboxyvinyltransferase [Dongia mobilis]TDQ77578.1 UDP-N-acetylglucosamine 1-carboxyvinyltransferase [Dongia mobilis]
MDRIRIRGGRQLNGQIRISGAKNAALPLMATCLLTDEDVRLDNVPDLADITTMTNLLTHLGIEVTTRQSLKERSVILSAKSLSDTTAPYDLVRKMRASVLVLGPLVARHRQAKVSLPGGCAIGTRPVDLHIKGLQQLGAEIELDSGYILAKAPNGLRGAEVTFPKVSVGATENLLMAATLAEGETHLINAAREPEITDLAQCLNAMGARIEGLGTDHLKVTGVERLQGCTHRVVADRIEAGTYAMAAAITGGEVELVGLHHELIGAAAAVLTQAGVSLSETAQGVLVKRTNGALTGVDVMTEPFPGFPTDLQAQMMALMTTADGASMITETIFENRFMHVPELARMGASINVHGASAMVRGVKKLTGAPVMATDLRASVSLVLAGLAAEGDTFLNRIYHLDRGYEKLTAKLSNCGAEIERLSDGAAE